MEFFQRLVGTNPPCRVALYPGLVWCTGWVLKPTPLRSLQLPPCFPGVSHVVDGNQISSPLSPLRNMVLVQKTEAESKTPGGLLLPSDVRFRNPAKLIFTVRRSCRVDPQRSAMRCVIADTNGAGGWNSNGERQRRAKFQNRVHCFCRTLLTIYLSYLTL